MRPGDTVTGTTTSALITGMQFSINLRTTVSEMVLIVRGKTLEGKKQSGQWSMNTPVVNPTLTQIGNAMTALSNTAEAEIIGLLSGNPG